MPNVLPNINSIGDKRGVLWGINKVFRREATSTSGLRNLASVIPDFSVDIDALLAVLKAVNLIEVQDGRIRFTQAGERLGDPSSSFFWAELSKLFFETLLSYDGLDNSQVHFEPEKNRYVILRSGFRLSFALLRNTLIQIGAIIEEGESFYVRDDLLTFFEEKVQQQYRKITLEKLKKDLERKQEIGDAGESFALKFEKDRVSCFSNNLAGRVRLISSVDVTAGYDMVSFERERSSTFDRFIEVKTFSGRLCFHWSKNEMEKAKLLRSKYWLYLVDYHRLGEDGYKPLIINDPYENVYLKSDKWLCEADALQFLKLDTTLDG